MRNFKKPTTMSVHRFLTQDTIGAFDAETSAADLFDAWRSYCEQNDFYLMTPNWFGRALTANGLQRREKDARVHYMGIKLKPVEEISPTQ